MGSQPINPFAKAAPVVEPESDETEDQGTESVEQPTPTAAPPKAAKTAPKAPKAPGSPTLPGMGAGGGLPIGGQPPAGGMPAAPGLPDASQFNPYGNAPSAAELTDDFVIDLTDVQSGGRDYIAPGRHLMYCESVTTGVSKNQNPKLVLVFVVASGDYVGKRANQDLALTPAAMWKYDQVLAALGVINKEDLSTKKPTVGDIKKKAYHKLIVGEFVADTYNGSPSVSFATVYPPDELGIRTGTTLEEAQRGA
jgi:hypothetical protein